MQIDTQGEFHVKMGGILPQAKEGNTRNSSRGLEHILPYYL